MTPDPILILATTTILLSLAGLYLFARLRAAESLIYEMRFDRLADNRRTRIEIQVLEDLYLKADAARFAHTKDIANLRQDLTQTARDAAKTTDDLTDLRGEYLAQARALDAHDERLQALEQDAADLSAAHFKTATTVEDHGERLDYVERYAPEP
jgi:chromosome segregation ATPase